MRYEVICKDSKDSTWIRGQYESDTNATVLDDNDRRWNEVCEHIKSGGDYDLGAADEPDSDEIQSYYTADHGDSVWPK